MSTIALFVTRSAHYAVRKRHKPVDCPSARLSVFEKTCATTQKSKKSCFLKSEKKRKIRRPILEHCRLSVCPIGQQQLRRPAGLLLSAGAGQQQILIDSCGHRATRGPRKFWPDCKEVQCIVYSLSGVLVRGSELLYEISSADSGRRHEPRGDAGSRRTDVRGRGQGTSCRDCRRGSEPVYRPGDRRQCTVRADDI